MIWPQLLSDLNFIDGLPPIALKLRGFAVFLDHESRPSPQGFFTYCCFSLECSQVDHSLRASGTLLK